MGQGYKLKLTQGEAEMGQQTQQQMLTPVTRKMQIETRYSCCPLVWKTSLSLLTTRSVRMWGNKHLYTFWLVFKLAQLVAKGKAGGPRGILKKKIKLK